MSLSVVGADGSTVALALLLTQADEQDRSNARAIEQQDDQAALREDESRVEQMDKKASDDASQALASGLAGIIGGAFTAGSAFVPGSSSGASDQGTNWSAVLKGVGDGAQAIGNVVSGGSKAASERDDASAAQFESQAQAHVRRYGEARDAVQSATESLQRVRQFLDQTQATENAARLAAAGYRG